MAELLCLWQSDLALVKFGLLNFITHSWLGISQTSVRCHSDLGIFLGICSVSGPVPWHRGE